MLSRYWQNRTAILDKLKQKLSFLDNFKPKLLTRLNHRTNNNLVALEFDTEHLKLLKINSTKQPFLVECFAINPLPTGAIVKDEIKDQVAVGNTLKETFRQSGLTTKKVALAIPRSIAIIKNITIDSRLTPDEIESRAWIEANRHFPDLVGNIYLDFTIMDHPKDALQLEMILVACRKDQIKPYLEVLRQAGLNASIIDVNCYALERALPLVLSSEKPLDTVALMNINLNLSTLIVMNHNVMIYAHDQGYDGQRLLSQVQTYLKNKGIDEKSAPEALVDDADYFNILKENLISHLRHTVHFFYSSRPNTAIQEVIVAGDCAGIPLLAVFIEREIGVKARIANPLTQLELAPHINAEDFALHAPALVQCVGLALSKVDHVAT